MGGVFAVRGRLTGRPFRVSHSPVRYALPVALLASILSIACSSDPAATAPATEPSVAPLPPVTVPGGDAGADVEVGPQPTDAATPDAGPAADCTREGRAKTAPAALYDALVADLGPLSSDAARRARVATFLAEVSAKGGGALADPGSDRGVGLASVERTLRRVDPADPAREMLRADLLLSRGLLEEALAAAIDLRDRLGDRREVARVALAALDRAGLRDIGPWTAWTKILARAKD